MSANGVVAILAGGQGRRLWPLSTPDRPKQFVPLFEGRSMLQMTFDRAAAMVGPESVFLVGNARHAGMYAEQLDALKEDNLILEPQGRGTAAALALVSLVCSRIFPDASVATIPSDHIISDPGEWTRAIRSALEFVQTEDRLVCLGSKPKVHDTKFGYMVVGETIGGPGRHPVNAVDRFVEKPDAVTLAKLVAQGRCVRNMGTLVFKPDVLAMEMERYLPQVYGPIAAAAKSSPEAMNDAYANIPVSSIDASVLQHSDRLAVVYGDIESDDAGDFVTLGDAIGRDTSRNASSGRLVAVEASDNTVFAEDTTVALVGVSGLVVVVDGNRVLICPKDQTQRIREIPENT